MPTISIRNTAAEHALALSYSCTIIVRPEIVAGPDLSKLCGPRGLHIVRLRSPPYPDDRNQCETWFRPVRDIALSNDDGERLIAAPDVVDFVTGEFAREAMSFSHVVITVVANTVTDAVLKLVSHDIPAEHVEDTRIVDLTGCAPTLVVEVPDRTVVPAIPPRIPTPGQWSLDEYVANDHFALAHRGKHEKFDPAFTGVFEKEDLRHHVRNGWADWFDLGVRARKLRRADRKGVISIADRAPGFGLINQAGLLEVWVHVTGAPWAFLQ
ncbi:hypothetical protein QD357_30895 [Rhizobium sp. BR 317]|uniref:hypothetical protein n=1 Tax=Rhizobium sp. BR 317 TaxID=3040015 RepID=UPI0039BF62DA